MEDSRPSYFATIYINNRKLQRIIIDQHYKIRHSEIDDLLILNLVRKVSGKTYEIEQEKDDFFYLKVEPVVYNEKPYRLILALPQFDDYLGVVNAYRIRKK